MKHLLKLVTMIVMITSFSFALEKPTNLVIGFDASVLIGKVKYEDGGIKSVLGLSPGLGIGYKNYFTPLKHNQFSLYWDVGTDLLILPFIGIGGDYKFEVSNASIYAGINVSSRLAILMIPIPSINVGIYF